jgi:hypothetical protein
MENHRLKSDGRKGVFYGEQWENIGFFMVISWDFMGIKHRA